MGSPEIQTARLILRPFRTEDIDDVFGYAGDPEVGRFVFAMPYPYARSDAKAFLESCLAASSSDHYRWAVTFNGKVIGGIDSDVQVEHHRAELGYALGREYWGQGFATEAAVAVLAWVFDRFDVERIYAYADARNTASRHVLEKCGMTFEGLLRQHRVHRGEQIDEVWYGMLRSEWRRPDTVIAL